MIANLPLLFVNGHPAALSGVSAAELEKFITFMVTCSWGHDTAKDIRRPPWWPADVDFSHPFVRPYEVPRDWETRLKNLVKSCYDYHKSPFLLVFSAQLARYPRKRLRYVDNKDHTTSLYYRPNGKLLVTFRNENLFYDKRPVVVKEPQLKSADIYLCDNCDSHFDNIDIFRAHERLCNNEVLPSSSISGGLPEFLSALKLQQVGEKTDSPKINSIEAKARNARSVANIDRGPPYPFSSLAYMKNAKTPSIQRDTSFSRERIERYCDPILTSKQVVSKSKRHQFPVRFRRPIDYWQRKYTFPKQRFKEVLDLKGQLFYLKCKPITIDIERMPQEKMDEYIENLRKEARKRAEQEEKDIIYVDGLDCEPTEEEIKSTDPLKKLENDCEVIDLCSDDETPSVNENCDPRAGVTCVMRGGAVLRRTAATPLALPAEPCGARQGNLPAAVLQPHPVLLIAHTFNNLQTISLE